MGSVGKGSSESMVETRLPESHDVSESDIDRLRRQMGQTGYEAGDPDAAPRSKLYVNTSKSMNINAYLTSDGESFYSPESGWNYLINEAWIKRAITKVDSGMRDLPESINLTRFVNKDAFGKMIGSEALGGSGFDDMLRTLSSDPSARSSFTQMLKNVDYTHKGFTSTNYTKSHDSYGDRDVVLNMVARQGTSAIMTRNVREHEVLLGRNLKYNFTGGWSIRQKSDGTSQLVLDVYV